MKKKIFQIFLGVMLSFVFSVSAFADPEGEDVTIEASEEAPSEEEFSDDLNPDIQNDLLAEETEIEETEEGTEEEYVITDFEGNDLLPEMEEVELQDGEDIFSYVDENVVVNVFNLTDRIQYLSETQMYLYKGSNGDEIMASVMDEMVVSYAVYLDYGVASSYKLYKDGVLYEMPEDHLLRSFGSYSVMKESKSVPETCYSFRIVPEVTNDLTVYQMPLGFRINSVLKDGEIVDSDEYYVSFKDEGAYIVTYECPYIQRAFTFEVEIDRTAPELSLKEVNEKGYASKPVDISDRGATDLLSITLNGKEIKEPDDLKLREVGNYEVSISDKAGNISSYSFVLRPYINISATVAFIILGVILALVIGFIIYSRKFMRVR